MFFCNILESLISVTTYDQSVNFNLSFDVGANILNLLSLYDFLIFFRVKQILSF